MFDRVACAACHEADTANVSLYALAALADLIRDAGCTSFNKSDSSSRTDAALASEPTIRRSANAAQNDDDVTRAIPWGPIQDCYTAPALAEPARRDAASANEIDDTPDDGTCGHGGQGEQS